VSWWSVESGKSFRDSLKEVVYGQTGGKKMVLGFF